MTFSITISIDQIFAFISVIPSVIAFFSFLWKKIVHALYIGLKDEAERDTNTKENYDNH